MPYNMIFAATDFLNRESSGGVTSVLKLIGLIILCILIIAASYFTTKFVGQRQLRGSAKSNFRNIDIYRISTNKYLQIVEIGEKYFCIAVSKDNITLIAELDKEDIKNFPPAPGEKSFKECMSLVLNKKKAGKKDSISDVIKNTGNIEDSEDPEEDAGSDDRED